MDLSIMGYSREDSVSDIARPPRARAHVGMLARKDWVPDRKATHCSQFGCGKQFSFRVRRHHCRRCGLVFCGEHSSRQAPLEQLGGGMNPGMPPLAGALSSGARLSTSEGVGLFVRVCDSCYHELQQPVTISEGLLHGDLGDGEPVTRDRNALFREFRGRFNDVERTHMQPVVNAYQRVCVLTTRQRDTPVVPWEADKPVCSECNRLFTKIRRRHHCRLCGRNCCDDCAPSRSFRAPPPGTSGDAATNAATVTQCRACVRCAALLSRHERTRAIAEERALIAQSGLTTQFTMLSQSMRATRRSMQV